MNNKPVAWEGAEEWEPLAWELCADEHGEESCTDLIWDMGVIPEPWGERWQKYEDEAKRMIAMVRKCTHPVKELDEDFDAICLENKRLQAEIEALKLHNKKLQWALAEQTNLLGVKE